MSLQSLLTKVQDTWKRKGGRGLQRPPMPRGRLPALLRSLRLQLFVWNRKAEPKKVAIYQSRTLAIFHAFLHLVPMGFMTTLIVYNLRIEPIAYPFFKDMNLHSPTINNPALQFVAKVLEVLAQASIAVIVLAFVRNEIIGSAPVPFGILTAPYRITNVSYLWSLEFWGLFTSTNTRRMYKLKYLIIPFGIVLAALIGPSTAVLLIPRPVQLPYTPINNILLIMQKETEVYDDNMDLADGFILSETETNLSLAQIGAASLDRPLQLTSSYGYRRIDGSFHDNHILERASNTSRTVWTIPTNVSSIYLSRLSAETSQLSIQAIATQPYVVADCDLAPQPCSTDQADGFLQFGYILQSRANTSIPCSSFADNSLSSPNSEPFGIERIVVSMPETNGSLTYLFSSPPSNLANHSVLFAFYDDRPSSDTATLVCVIDAYWAMHSSSHIESSINSNTDMRLYNESKSPVWPPKNGRLISLSPSWASRVFKLGPPHLDDDSSSLASAALAKNIAVALSNIPPAKRPSGYFWYSDPKYDVADSIRLLDGDLQSIEQQISKGHYSKLVTFERQNNKLYDTIVVTPNETDWDNLDSLATLRWEVKYNVLGYDAGPIAVRLSLAVLMTYVLYTSLYILWTLYTGRTATSWDSMSEALALALHSERPDTLHNAAVEISTLNTFRKPVNIRLNGDGSPEFVFGKEDADEHSEHERRLRLRGYTHVVPNERY